MGRFCFVQWRDSIRFDLSKNLTKIEEKQGCGGGGHWSVAWSHDGLYIWHNFEQERIKLWDCVLKCTFIQQIVVFLGVVADRSVMLLKDSHVTNYLAITTLETQVLSRPWIPWKKLFQCTKKFGKYVAMFKSCHQYSMFINFWSHFKQSL